MTPNHTANITGILNPPGHAEMSSKTMFIKYNTGPTGHGSPAAAGEALALARAGLGTVKVFVMDGEGGMTAGGSMETLNSGYGLSLSNLCFLLDWNDFGIDDHSTSDIVYGDPKLWFESHGWETFGTNDGSDWESLNSVFAASSVSMASRPKGIWFKTRKGRGYGKYDYASHGAPHGINSEAYWKTKVEFANKYGVEFVNFGEEAPEVSVLKEEFAENINVVMDVLRKDPKLIAYISDRLVLLADSLAEVAAPKMRRTADARSSNEFLFDYENYPEDLYAAPGTKISNRNAFSTWGAWVNAKHAAEFDRPLFIGASADLTDSTGVKGFGSAYGVFPGYGWYKNVGADQGCLLPQGITEFANAGICCGLASVNFASDPQSDFEGFWGVTSTYGSFSYLKYGAFRLFSQTAQDCGIQLGKVIWVVGHSGPETADDSRTHFGIFSPAVTQLFPRGSIINLHPWEYNEVPVLLAAALKEAVNIVALHLTRPQIAVPDRTTLQIPHYYEAAKGAYILQDYDPARKPLGTFYAQGTSAVNSVLELLPIIRERGLNIKIVCLTSSELFNNQPEDYQEKIVDRFDRNNSTVISTQARTAMRDWLFSADSEAYAITPDWDDRWRTGGRLEDVLDEARLSPDWIMCGIEAFVGRNTDH